MCRDRRMIMFKPDSEWIDEKMELINKFVKTTWNEGNEVRKEIHITEKALRNILEDNCNEETEE